AFRVGELHGGLPGALAAGGLAAFLPSLLGYSVMATPYGAAWSFAILAYHQAAFGRRGAAVLLGLAIGSRIELVLLAPLFGRRPRFHAAVLITALIVSPWWLMHLLGNLRGIATVRLLGPAFSLSGVADLAWKEGLGVAIAVAAGGLAAQKRWWHLAYLAALLVTAAKPSGFGVRHQGPVIVATLLLATPKKWWLAAAI